MKVKVIGFLGGLAALSFFGGWALQRKPMQAEAHENASPDLEAERIARDRSKLAKAVSGSEVQSVELERSLALKKQENLALLARVEKAEEAAKAAAIEKTPTFELPEAWKTMDEKDFGEVFAGLYSRGEAAYSEIDAMLTDGHETVFDEGPTLAYINSSLKAPSLRFSLILRLGELGDDRSLERIRRVLESDPSVYDVSAAAMSLLAKSTEGDADRDLMRRGLKSAMARESGVVTQWAEKFREFRKTLPKDLQSFFRRLEAGKDQESSPEAQRRLRELFGPWVKENPLPPRNRATQVYDLHRLIRVLGAEAFIPEIRGYVLAEFPEAIKAMGYLGKAVGLRELKTLYQETNGGFNRDRMRLPVMKEIINFADPEGFAFLLGEYPALDQSAQARLVQAVVNRFNPATSEFRDRPVTKDQALLAIRFLKSLLPLSPKMTESGERFADQIELAMSRVRSCQKLE